MAKQYISQDSAKNRAAKSGSVTGLSKQSTITESSMVTLQNSIGNRAVQHLLVQRQENDPYADEAYGIMNSSMDPQLRLQLLVEAQNRRLAGQGVPPVGVGSLPPDSGNLGEGDFTGWELDLNATAMDTSTAEGRADAANTVGHEGEHLRQWYEMARLQAGLQGTNQSHGEGPLSDIPESVALQANLDPILQSDAHTFQVQQWYESVYGGGSDYRNQVLGNEDATQGVSRDMRAEYCRLPEERDAWARGMQITDRFREIEGIPTPPIEQDPAICNPEEMFSQ